MDVAQQVLIPMAGRGSRFEHIYDLPKPLIDVYGKPMIQQAVETLAIPGNYIFVVLQEHLNRFSYLEDLLLSLNSKVDIIVTQEITQGPASTCLLAKDLINNSSPLLIANCDQVMCWDSVAFLEACTTERIDGMIVTYTSVDPKNSFVEMTTHGVIKRVVEKIPVSNEATVGLYWWKQGQDFVRSAESMIQKNERYNNEYYVGPAYNQLINEDMKIVKSYHVDNPFLIGTPADLNIYLENVASLT